MTHYPKDIKPFYMKLDEVARPYHVCRVPCAMCVVCAVSRVCRVCRVIDVPLTL